MTVWQAAGMSWQETPGALRLDATFTDFAEAFAFLTRVAALAEEMDHHPDMSISWNKVTLVLTTHSEGSTVTDLDRRLAARIDGVIAG